VDSQHYLTGLVQQMAWADAYIWSRVLASPTAATDARLLNTFHHIHFIQHFFRQAWNSEPGELTASTDFPTAAALARYGRDANLKIQRFLDSTQPAALEAQFREPWTDQFEARFPRPAAPHTLAESIVQVVLHTAHHRGQACVRLRELGCQPPTVDFIVWLWAGKPAPDWSCIDDPQQAGQFQET
jgi:uncharacterized damage-inducible protein DinB